MNAGTRYNTPVFYLADTAAVSSEPRRATADPVHSALTELLIGDRGQRNLRPYRYKCQQPQQQLQSLFRRLVLDTPYWRRRVDILILYCIAVINLVLLEHNVYSTAVPEEVTIFEWIVIFWVFLLGVAYSYLQNRFNVSLTNYAVRMCSHVIAVASNVEPALKTVNLTTAVTVVEFVLDPAQARQQRCSLYPYRIEEASRTLAHVLKNIQHILRALPYAASVGFRNRQLRTELLPMPPHLHTELSAIVSKDVSCLEALVDMLRSRIGYLYRAATISRQMQSSLLELLNELELSGAETAFWNYTRPISVFLRHLLTLSLYPSLIYLPFVSYRQLGFVLSLLLVPLALIVLLGADELLNTLYDPFDTDTDIINIGTSVSVWTRKAVTKVDATFDLLLDKLLLWYLNNDKHTEAETERK